MTFAGIITLAAANIVAVGPVHHGPRLNRMAIVVGNNHGLSDELDLRYAETDAEKVAKVLTDLAGFTPDEVTLLTGRRQDELQSAFRELQSRSRSGDIDERTLLFFYFSGHGDEGNLHMSGSRMPFTTLRELLRAVDAQVSITLMDSCKSGALTRAKGATLGPAYEIELLKDPEVEGRIVITSSSEDEVSQESDKIEGSFFTHHWVSGLYGAADANMDSLVTLEEAYRYAHYRTVEQTIESSGGVQHPSYNFSLTGQGNVVLANLTNSTARVRLDTSAEPGSYFVLDAEKQLILTELAHKPLSTVVLRLPPGEYIIRKREAARILVARVMATPGGLVTLADGSMRQVPYVDLGTKGIEEKTSVDSHGPLVSAGIRTGLTDEMSLAWQLRGGYTIRWRRFFVEPRLAFRRSKLGKPAIFAHNEIDFGALAGVNAEIDQLRLDAGIDAGLVFFDRERLRAQTSTAIAPQSISGAVSLGVATNLIVRAEYPIAAFLTVVLSASAGAVFFEEDAESSHAWVFGALSGLAYRF